MSLVAIGARLRAICLALPEANEELMRRGPSYRVADKIFALERPWNGWLALWCKVPEGSQSFILDAEPARFFIPPILAPGAGSASDWTKRPTGAKSRPSSIAAIDWSRRSGSASSWRDAKGRGRGGICKLGAPYNSVALERTFEETPPCRRPRPRAVRPTGFRSPRSIRSRSISCAIPIPRTKSCARPARSSGWKSTAPMPRRGTPRSGRSSAIPRPSARVAAWASATFSAKSHGGRRAWCSSATRPNMTGRGRCSIAPCRRP